MEYNIDDSDRSSSPPPTPTDKPLRSKRSGGGGGRKEDGGGKEGGLDGRVMMSSAQSTPDPGRVGAPGGAGGYFGSVASPGVNGAQTVLPPLHSLPALQPQQPTRTYYDPAADNDGAEDAGRRRAYSGAQAPQNGDTEMRDAGFAPAGP